MVGVGKAGRRAHSSMTLIYIPLPWDLLIASQEMPYLSFSILLSHFTGPQTLKKTFILRGLHYKIREDSL